MGSIVNDDESWKVEAQFLLGSMAYDIILGASYFEADNREVLNFPPIVFSDEMSTSRLTNVFGYVYFEGNGLRPHMQLGFSFDDVKSNVADRSEVSPKLGLIWNLSDSFTIRAAGFRVLTRPVNADEALEPTQLAGFNQLFDDPPGAESDSGGLGVDFRLSTALAAGLEFSRRNLKAPATDATTGEIFFQDQREDVVSGYLNWLVSDQLSLTFEPRYHDFEHGITFSEFTLAELPISAKLMLPSGLWAGISATNVEQSGFFDGPDGLAQGSDRFWVVDAVLAYRLPLRRGTISLEGTNLFDETFQFQEIDLGVTPRYIPEAQVFLRVSIAF